MSLSAESVPQEETTPHFPAELQQDKCRTALAGLTSAVTLAPKSQPAPRGLMAHVSTSSGSDHTKSAHTSWHSYVNTHAHTHTHCTTSKSNTAVKSS